MAKITFIEHNGTQHPVDASHGQSLMQAAIDNSVPGIDADCGGSCACGTCHVMIAPDWAAKAGIAGAEESSMLEMTPDFSPQSRLACQVEVDEQLDGMIVNLPEFQM